MPNYGAVGLIGGLFLIGALIYTIFTNRPQQERHERSEQRFNPEPGYDRPREEWGAEDLGAGRRRRRGRLECAICKEEILVRTDMRNLPCQHGFHDECITKWFRESRTCPTCRHPA